MMRGRLPRTVSYLAGLVDWLGDEFFQWSAGNGLNQRH
jgi:hypothetical protein